jgi:exodeoxyribonuclease III
MKLITWNCHHGDIESRVSLLEKFKADIIFLQEVKCPTTTDSHVRWFGTNKKKGHAIIVSEDYSISVMKDETIDPFVVPLIIDGKYSIHVLMVWTQKSGEYVEELQNPLKKYQTFLLERPSVIIGDFNSNAIWDKDHRFFNHSRMVTLFNEMFGLISAYHEKTKCCQGSERHPTLFHCYKPDRPFHIDYCFVPKGWTITDVTVGEYVDWISQSDHCPLIVDVDII